MRQSFASPSLDNLVDLACRDGVDIRSTLLRVLTDLYVQKPAHSAEEEVQYVELALGLIGSADAAARAAVAARLSTYPAAPAVVLDRLGVPRPASEKPPAESSRDLTDLFFTATAEERRLILVNLDAVAPAATRPPAPEAAIARLEQAAMQRNVGEFCRALDQALGVGRALAERIARDISGEPIVVAAKALRMKAAVLHRILLFLDPAIGQSVARVYDLARFYEELPPAAADRMLAIWRQAGETSRTRYEPVHWDDSQRNARSLATHSGHRVTRSPAPLPTRTAARDR